MGKAKRERKKGIDPELRAWFDEYSVACPWRQKVAHPNTGKTLTYCSATVHPMQDQIRTLDCQVLNCAPLYLANRLIQQTFGPRRYENDTPDPSRKH